MIDRVQRVARAILDRIRHPYSYHPEYTAQTANALRAADPVATGPASKVDIAARHFHAARSQAAFEGATLPDGHGVPDYTDTDEGGA